VDGGTVDVPKDPSNDVTVTTSTGEQIGIGIANGETAGDARTTASGTTVYTDPTSATATAVQATTDGVRQLFILNNTKASTAFTVPLTLPNGARLEKDGSGGYDIVPVANAEGVATSIAHIDAPWAKDASGRSLATSYSLDRTVLTQHVSTAGAVYPVVADPRLTYGSHNGFPTVYLNLWGSEVQAVAYAITITVGGTAAIGCAAMAFACSRLWTNSPFSRT